MPKANCPINLRLLKASGQAIEARLEQHLHLDIDALRIVANGVNKLKTKDNADEFFKYFKSL